MPLPEIIACDFDGTLCEDRWPDIGEPNHEVINYLKMKKREGVRLILWTCRADGDLEKAVDWCKEQGLQFDTVNANLPEVIAEFGNDTRKIFAHIYIDDKSFGGFILPFTSSKIQWTKEDIQSVETLAPYQNKYWLTDFASISYSDHSS
jgi:hydroxymethylpyrimidine pyrophosphatase-like HAD family hydrolase